ncbi:MAG: methyltransferase domain-containing protein [Cyanobacteriota bacterium]
MKQSLLSWLSCPQCRGTLSLSEAKSSDDKIESGSLDCAQCKNRYPIIRSIPRFVPQDNYAGSFGFQWNRFRQTQLDSYSGLDISRDRFLRSTGWNPELLTGKTILDVGCGAGRFVEAALSFGAQVFAIDYSQAVEACFSNFPNHPNLHVLQADIYTLPFKGECFDYVYCLGVLQHTPDPHQAFNALPSQLKPGGYIAVDVYQAGLRNLLHSKYWFRHLTTRIPRSNLFQSIERSMPFVLPISRGLGRIPAVGNLLKRFIPVANYEGIYPLNEEQLHEWAVLDTFDMLSPTYDNPQTPQTLHSWLTGVGLEEIEVGKFAHLVGRGRKPVKEAVPCA